MISSVLEMFKLGCLTLVLGKCMQNLLISVGDEHWHVGQQYTWLLGGEYSLRPCTFRIYNVTDISFFFFVELAAAESMFAVIYIEYQAKLGNLCHRSDQTLFTGDSQDCCEISQPLCLLGDLSFQMGLSAHSQGADHLPFTPLLECKCEVLTSCALS